MCYISYHIQSNKAVQWYLSTLIRRSIYITGCLYPLAWELPLLFSKLARCFESFCSCNKGMGCWGGEKQGISNKSGHEDSPQHAACTSQWDVCLYHFFRQNQDPAEAVSSYSQFACLCDRQLPVSELYVPDTRLRVEQRNARVSRQTGVGRGSITVIQNLEESQSMLWLDLLRHLSLNGTEWVKCWLTKAEKELIGS